MFVVVYVKCTYTHTYGNLKEAKKKRKIVKYFL